MCACNWDTLFHFQLQFYLHISIMKPIESERGSAVKPFFWVTFSPAWAARLPHWPRSCLMDRESHTSAGGRSASSAACLPGCLDGRVSRRTQFVVIFLLFAQNYSASIVGGTGGGGRTTVHFYLVYMSECKSTILKCVNSIETVTRACMQWVSVWTFSGMIWMSTMRGGSLKKNGPK